MRLFPNAKINIGLNIIEKRPDGYHNIETVFYPISLADELIVNLSDVSLLSSNISDYNFSMAGMCVDGDPEKNLIIKAYRLLQQTYELGPIDVFLKKNIPSGAGLGGGSSDAAYMLKALDDLFKLNLTQHELEGFAVQLGADCPVFIQNKVVFAEGIGDVFFPVELSLKGYYIVLIKPEIFISTAEAYASVIPKVTNSSLLFYVQSPIFEWKNIIVNDFESAVFYKYPQIKQIKDQLYGIGAIYASMSGSGASVYGIFDTYPTDLKGFENYFIYVDRI